MKIGIICHLGGNENFNDGQTVKSISLYRALSESGICMDVADTYYAKKNIFYFFYQLIKLLIKNKKIIIMLSQNGRKVLFPVLYVMSRFFGKDVYHYAIGGKLGLEASSNKNTKKYISKFNKNWVESKILAEQLKELGVDNAEYLPNFKNIKPISETELQINRTKPFRLCTFSRVVKEKGIEDAIEAVCAINKEAKEIVVTLDIYGPIDNQYKARFDSILSRSENCKYCGIVSANNSVDVLKKYFALIFPTYWAGECMPGTIIDAMFAGLPVIARRWCYCDEMIEDNVTGYIYDNDKLELLKEKILYAILHVEDIYKMRKRCLKKSDDYSSQKIVSYIISTIT